jgi:hypothetical protein
MGTFILILTVIILWASISVAIYMKKKNEVGKFDCDSKLILKIVCGICGPSFMVAYIGNSILKSIIPEEIKEKKSGSIQTYTRL